MKFRKDVENRKSWEEYKLLQLLQRLFSHYSVEVNSRCPRTQQFCFQSGIRGEKRPKSKSVSYCPRRASSRTALRTYTYSLAVLFNNYTSSHIPTRQSCTCLKKHRKTCLLQSCVLSADIGNVPNAQQQYNSKSVPPMESFNELQKINYIPLVKLETCNLVNDISRIILLM